MFTFDNTKQNNYIMVEQITEFNAKMKELGIDPSYFFVITFYKDRVALQGNYMANLCKQLSLVCNLKVDPNGYVEFYIGNFTFTLC